MNIDELIYIFVKDFGKRKKISYLHSLGFSEEAQKELTELGFVFVNDGDTVRALKTPPVLCENLIMHFLKKSEKYKCRILSTVPSTNTFLKDLAACGESSYTFVTAEQQTAGRGRNDRVFLSPNNNGIYLSLLLRPSIDLSISTPTDSVLVTACAAVAAHKAIKAVLGIKTGIKWVNDIYLEGKKVCGILCEGSYCASKNEYEYIVVGIGINLFGNFIGTDIENIASSLLPENKYANCAMIKNKLTAVFLNYFDEIYRNQIGKGTHRFIKEYRKALFIIGKDVEVICGNTVRNARVVDLNDDFSLSVEYSDHSREALSCGEVRLKIKDSTK